MNKKAPAWVLVLLFIVSLILIFFGVKEMNYVQNNLKNGIITTGKVTEIIRTQSHEQKRSNTYTYYPQITFTDKNGDEISFVSKLGSDRPGYAKGQEVSVLYNSNDSHKAHINSFWGLYGVLVVLFGGALMFLTGGLVFLYDKMKNRTQITPPTQT